MTEILKAESAPEMQLHQAWWVVMKPKMIVLRNGQPAYDIAAACETEAQALSAARGIPGAAIVLNFVAHINPTPRPPGQLAKT